RLSDAGHGASRIAAIGRHPKPSTATDSCTAVIGSNSLARGRCWRAFDVDSLCHLCAAARRRDIGERKPGYTLIVLGQRPQFVLADVLVEILKRLVTDQFLDFGIDKIRWVFPVG